MCLNTCTKRALSLSSFINLSIIIIIFGLSIAFGFRLFELHLPFFIMNSANRKMNSNSRMNSNFLLLFFYCFWFSIFSFQNSMTQALLKIQTVTFLFMSCYVLVVKIIF